MYLSTFVDDSVDIQVITKSLKFVNLTKLAKFGQKCQKWQILTILSNSEHNLSTFVDDSVAITNILKTINFTKITNLTRSDILINSDRFRPDLSIYILVYIH